jgi:hypothetical protein
MKSLYIFFFSLLIIGITARGQDVPLGSWKDYLSYRNGITVTMGKNIVYCVAGSGIFSYNLNDNSVEKLNKVTGLSDVDPTVARCSPDGKTLIIGYTDGNMDLLQNNTIINIPDLKNSGVQGSKNINCIYFPANTNYALIGCGQGIMQLDLSQDVILNTYYLGTLGAALNVRGITVYKDSIFATTDIGISKGALNDPFLTNYNDWVRVPNTILPWGKYNSIVTVGDSVFSDFSLFATEGVYDKDTIFVYSEGQWSRYLYCKGNTTVYSLEASKVGNKNYLVASTHYTLNAFDMSNNSQPINTGIYIFPGNTISTAVPYDALIDGNMNIWVADNTFGLVKANLPFYNATIYTPQGPYSNQVFNMAVSNNDLWVVAGAYDINLTATYNGTGASVLENGTWNYIPNNPGVADLNCIAVDPWNPVHAFAGSWGAGLEEFGDNAIINVWDSSNTKTNGQYNGIQNIDAPFENFRTGGVAYDTLGDVWVTNSLAISKYLTVEKPDLSWHAVDFGGLVQQGASVTTVMVTQTQAKWMLFNGLGILAYQDNGTLAKPSSSNTQLITTATGGGGLPDLNVNCMTEDKNGSIWVGTDLRVMVFYSPDNVFDGNKDWDAQPVYVTQNGYTQYLMQNQNTTAIAVDGANQKWIGTAGGGVFLMSADGTQQIYNFTTSNSPLLSNNIQSIVINPNNGEVFFATDKGIVSFRGSATEGTPQFGNVYAFPDPVPHGYSGPIAIKNLVSNSDVRVTTINGELVYHTIAEGGQAVWNGNNFDGNRVQTGVYLVFCVSPDGMQTKVAKLLFIN